MTQSLNQLESFINFRTKIYNSSLINCKNYHQLFLNSTETKMEKTMISWNWFLASGSAQPWMIVCQLGRGAGDWGNPPKIGRNLNFSSGNFMNSRGNSRKFSWIQVVPWQQDPRNPRSPEMSKEKRVSQLCWYLKQAAFLICLAGMILWQKITPLHLPQKTV